MDVERLDDLRELIGEYWCLAFAEGQEGRNTDTPDGAAQKCISAIEAIIREARAALTPPEGHVVVTRNEAGQAVAVTRQDDEGRILSVIAEFEPPEGYVVVPYEFRDPNHLAEWLGSLVDGSEQEEWDAAQAAMIGVRAFQQHPAVIERLREAVEGECDGLSITAEQAAAIFDHVLEPSPLPTPPEVPNGRG